MQTDFYVWGCVVMDMEKIKDIVFTMENTTALIECKLKGIKKLLDMVNMDVFQTIYKPTEEGLITLYHQVNYYSEINELVVNNLDEIFNGINEIDKLINNLREEGGFKPQIE